MGSLSVESGFGWGPAANIHVKPGASWVEGKRVWIRDGSGWKIAWENEITDMFYFLHGQTYHATTGDSPDQNGYYGTRARWDDQGQKTQTQGEMSENDTYRDNRTWWTPGNGSTSGQNMWTTLLGRKVTGFWISLGLDWSVWHAWYGENNAASRMGLFANWNGPDAPDPFDPAVMLYMGTISWYPNSYDYARGYATIPQSWLGTNPNQNGDRFPVFRQNIDMYPQMSPTVKAKMVDGTIKGFTLQAYNENGENKNPSWDWHCAAVEPGQTFAFPHLAGGTYPPVTGRADAFRITIRHAPG